MIQTSISLYTINKQCVKTFKLTKCFSPLSKGERNVPRNRSRSHKEPQDKPGSGSGFGLDVTNVFKTINIKFTFLLQKLLACACPKLSDKISCCAPEYQIGIRTISDSEILDSDWYI